MELSPEQVQAMIALVQMLGAAGAVSAIMPLAVAMIAQSNWPRQAKELTVIVTCGIVAAIGVVGSGHDPKDLVVVIPTMVLATRVAYQKYWKNTGIAPWLEQVTDWNKQGDQDDDQVVGV